MERTRIGSCRSGDCGGDVAALHWSMPYRTLGNPRTQVLASGATHVDVVHGGALARSPLTSRPPDSLIDMRTDPVVSGPPPRFHAFPVSCAGPTRGPAGAHPVRAIGPTRHSDVHSQAPPAAAEFGNSEMRARGPSSFPHAPTVAVMHTAARNTARRRPRAVGLGRAADDSGIRTHPVANFRYIPVKRSSFFEC
jgi:hypothetical protein